MRKALLLTVLVISFTLLIFSATALAKNGPHQGPNMPQTTDACAGCHRAHTGTAEDLLKDGETEYAFCTSCHNGTGANTDVLGGDFQGISASYNDHDSGGVPGQYPPDGEVGKGLNGGGFTSAAAYTGRSGRIGFTGVSSKHDVGTPGTAWGGGADGGQSGGTSVALECSSCHDPHGSENSDSTERYRILKNTVNGVALGAIRSNEGAQKDYTKDQHKSGISALCVACHTQYMTPSSEYNAGDGKGLVTRHRHKVNVAISAGNGKTGNSQTIATNLNGNTKLPVEQGTYDADHKDGDIMTCLTCHQAHGTSATNTKPVAPANSSALLRLNNRGVCQDCHQK